MNHIILITPVGGMMLATGQPNFRSSPDGNRLGERKVFGVKKKKVVGIVFY